MIYLSILGAGITFIIMYYSSCIFGFCLLSQENAYLLFDLVLITLNQRYVSCRLMRTIDINLISCNLRMAYEKVKVTKVDNCNEGFLATFLSVCMTFYY